jgi:hypothetical protein
MQKPLDRISRMVDIPFIQTIESNILDWIEIETVSIERPLCF